MFDLDDTIVSFDSSSIKAWDKICREYTIANECNFTADEMNKKIAEVRREYWADPDRHKRGRENMINARREIMLIAMPLLGVTNSTKKIIAAADSYSATQEEMLSLFDGAYDAIKQLKSAGFKTALITNGSTDGQRRKIERFCLAPLFDEIIIDTEVGVSKPDKEIYHIALERLGVLPNEALMIGDKPEWDIIPAHELGIFSVWSNFKHIFSKTPASADLSVNSVAELVEIILTQG